MTNNNDFLKKGLNTVFSLSLHDVRTYTCAQVTKIHGACIYKLYLGFMLYDCYPEMKTEELFENWKRFMGLKSVPVGVSLQKHVCEKRAATQSQLLILYFEGQ